MNSSGLTVGRTSEMCGGLVAKSLTWQPSLPGSSPGRVSVGRSVFTDRLVQVAAPQGELTTAALFFPFPFPSVRMAPGIGSPLGSGRGLPTRGNVRGTFDDVAACSSNGRTHGFAATDHRHCRGSRFESGAGGKAGALASHVVNLPTRDHAATCIQQHKAGRAVRPQREWQFLAAQNHALVMAATLLPERVVSAGSNVGCFNTAAAGGNSGQRQQSARRTADRIGNGCFAPVRPASPQSHRAHGMAGANLLTRHCRKDAPARAPSLDHVNRDPGRFYQRIR